MNVLVKRPERREQYVEPFDRIWKNIDHEAPTRYYKPWLTKPAVNVLENADQFEIQIAVPGYTRADFKIKIENHLLEISLEKGKEEKKEKFIKKEFLYTPFHRKFELGNTIEHEQIKAEYTDGILKIILPKKEEAKPPVPRKIEIS